MDLTPVTLQGRIVRLEPLTEAHIPALAAAVDDQAVFRWLGMPSQPVDEAVLAGWVRIGLDWQRQGIALPFATVSVATGRVIGSTRFGAVEHTHRRAEIGWTWLQAAAQRSGANTEAKLLMLRHAFTVLGCIRVEFKTDRRNEKSRAALAGIGAVEEGLFRNHMVLPDGTYRDSVYFSIVDRDWPQVEAALEARLARHARPVEAAAR